MTYNDGNDFVPAQEKLEWVTPKISLMRLRESLKIKRIEMTIATLGPLFPFEPLTDYISNPSTPTKTNNTKGSLKTLFL